MRETKILIESFGWAVVIGGVLVILVSTFGILISLTGDPVVPVKEAVTKKVIVNLEDKIEYKEGEWKCIDHPLFDHVFIKLDGRLGETVKHPVVDGVKYFCHRDPSSAH